MHSIARIEQTLKTALEGAAAAGAPPTLAAAMHDAVFPGGHRIRPHLCLSVARACGDGDLQAAEAAAAAIELLHCASLVHDDLPCFDNAATRRGKPSVHAQYGAPLGVLTGDALIVLAFETLARGCLRQPHRLGPLVLLVAQSVGAPRGIVAGQAWECESTVSLRDYQRSKTGSLFIAATVAGATATGCDGAAWSTLGDLLGEAYQVADDLRDILCDEDELGKPIGQDAAHRRPNAAAQLGVQGAKNRLETLVRTAVESIPPCPGADDLRKLLKAQTDLFFPKQLARAAA